MEGLDTVATVSVNGHTILTTDNMFRRYIVDVKDDMQVCVVTHGYYNYYLPIGVNISERKSGTERTKKRKKRELVCFPTARGSNWYCSTSSRC